jgi:tryptophan synthase alpha chain
MPLSAIQAVFHSGKPAFTPYYTLGFPDYETSLAIIEACVANGAAMLELGLPFSDPLADGPTIQHSTHVALENGLTTAKCLTAVRELRKRGVQVPLIMFGYYNPILQYGVARYVREALAAGADGFLIPDLPPEEAGELDALCRELDAGLIYLVAPTSNSERLALVAQKARGFTYIVSVLGITGARESVSAQLGELVARVRAHIPTPLAVGFGISTPAQAAQVGHLADGVVIGSQLIKIAQAAHAVGQDPAAAVGDFVRTVVTAMAA